MSARLKPLMFDLVEIDAFDARRGYKRCSLPGVGYTPDPNPDVPWLRPIWVTTDFWRSPTGALVVRFSSSQPWVFHFEATLANGKPVLEEAMEEFADFVAAVLFEWGGTDDPPDPDAGNLATKQSFRKSGGRK